MLLLSIVITTSGICVTFGVGNFITSSKVQKLNSKSSTDAESIAVSDGMYIPLWLVDFLFHRGYKKYPITSHAAPCWPKDNDQLQRPDDQLQRFIEIRKFEITDYIRTGAVKIVYVPTEDMTSDNFTKPLQGTVFTKMVKKIWKIKLSSSSRPDFHQSRAERRVVSDFNIVEHRHFLGYRRSKRKKR